MLNFRKKKVKHSAKAGLPPGALIHIGQKSTDPVTIELLDYNEKSSRVEEGSELPAVSQCLKSETVSWVNVNGIHDTDLISEIGKAYKIHDLVLEDILNTEHYPKVEPFDSYVFFTMKMMSLKDGAIRREQLSIVFSKTFVLCFQERKGDVFDPLRERIQKGSGIIRKKGTDYLVYRLIDTVVDNYFFIVENIEERLETLEEAVIVDTDNDHTREIQMMKREILALRRSLVPLRDAVSSLEKGVSELIEPANSKYFHDVYDHLIQIHDMLETNREMLSGMMDMQMANMSNRMNQVMKVLTVIATIFIPLTFIAGIYGMNFDHMPELHYRYGYYIVWAVMLVVFAAMLAYFRNKKWF